MAHSASSSTVHDDDTMEDASVTSTPAQPISTTSASIRVSQIPELLENILIHIGDATSEAAIKQLVRFRRTSATFRNTIDESPELQSLLWLRAPDMASTGKRYHINPLFCYTLYPAVGPFSRGLLESDLEHTRWQTRVSMNDKLRIRVNEWWKKMVLAWAEDGEFEIRVLATDMRSGRQFNTVVKCTNKTTAEDVCKIVRQELERIVEEIHTRFRELR